jgi:hypothetical protein
MCFWDSFRVIFQKKDPNGIFKNKPTLYFHLQQNCKLLSLVERVVLPPTSDYLGVD